MLLDAGANINIQNQTKFTPLMSASIQRGHHDLVRLLIERGANLNLQDSRGNTALMLASSLGDVETVKILLDADANPYIKNQYNKDALSYAIHDTRKTKLIKEKLEQK